MLMADALLGRCAHGRLSYWLVCFFWLDLLIPNDPYTPPVNTSRVKFQWVEVLSLICEVRGPSYKPIHDQGQKLDELAEEGV